MKVKKWLCTTLVLCLSVLCLSATAFAAEAGDVSGDLNAAKPSKHEIYQKWSEVLMPDSIYEEEPSVTAPYKTGSLSDSFLASGVGYINYVRYLAGLPEVQLSDVLNDYAQHGAVVLAANDTLTHYPTQPEDMDDAFYEKALKATTSSNLSARWGSLFDEEEMLASAIVGCMEDTGSYTNMATVGHRRWLLNPTLLNVGFGYAVSETGASYVDTYCHDWSGTGCDYNFISWPASGYFPSRLFSADSAWSVTLNLSKYKLPSLTQVKVTLTRQSDGKTWSFDGNTGEPPANGVALTPYMTVNNQGYGVSNCIIFHPGSENIDEYDGVFTVKITGIYDKSGKAAEISYKVAFFDVTSSDFHQCDTVTKIEPTCTSMGATAYICECGYYYLTSYVDSLGHDYSVDITTAPTCTSTGVATYTCQRCSDSYTYTMAMTDHVYDQPTVVPSTCSYEGYTTYSCVCGMKSGIRENYTAKLSHNYVEEYTAPTCTTSGVLRRICSECNNTQVTYYAPTDHTYVDTVIEPTCSEGGRTVHTCACGDTYTDSWVNSLGHSFEGAEISFDGGGLHSWKCIRCDERKIRPCYKMGREVSVPSSIQAFGQVRTYCTECGGTDEQQPFIHRIYGANRCATTYQAADELKVLLGVSKFDAIILASGSNFADALAGSYLAAVKGAPILLHMSGYESQNLAYIKENLVDGGTVYILGGTGSVPAKMEQLLADYHVERLAGSNRFGTDLKILEAAGVQGKEILVVTGYNFADSLSASATGLPILMVDSSAGLSAEQLAFLKAHKDSAYTILGGPYVVSEALEKTIEETTGQAVQRIYGAAREETSVKVAQRYFDAPDTVLLAYSRNFPDGLCGGPVAYAANAPLLLTNKGCEAPAAAYVKETGLGAGAVLGGPAMVSNATVESIFNVDFTTDIPQ